MYIKFQVTPSKETLTSWQNRPQQVVANYIKKVLELNANGQNGQTTEVTFFKDFDSGSNPIKDI